MRLSSPSNSHVRPMPGNSFYTELWLQRLSTSSLTSSNHAQASEVSLGQNISSLLPFTPDTANLLSTLPSVREQQPPGLRKAQFETHKRAALDPSLDSAEHTRSHSPRKRQRSAFSDVGSTSQLSDVCPSRELREIYRFATPPLKFSPSPDDTTPKFVLDLIKSLPLNGVSVIPTRLKQPIQSKYPLENVPEHAFGATATDVTNSDEEIFNLIISQVEKAREHFRENEPEAPWVALDTNVLEHVFAQPALKGMLSVKDVQHSDINSKRLLPQVNDAAIPAKKADLAIALSNTNQDVRALYHKIRTKEPTIQLSQMSETSVSRLTLPGCVEVGEPGKSYLEAALQLGVWCYAGLKKLEELQSQSGSLGNSGDTLLFGFAAVGSDWKLHFAYNEEGGGVTILGPYDSGGPKGIFQAFILHRVVEALAKWILTEYWPNFKRIFQDP